MEICSFSSSIAGYYEAAMWIGRSVQQFQTKLTNEVEKERAEDSNTGIISKEIDILKLVCLFLVF